MRIACFCNKILSSSPLTYTLGFSRGGVRDTLTHCMHLKGELELLLGFDSLPFHLARLPFFFLFFFFILEIYQARESVRTRSDEVAECRREEHFGFAEQQEEKCLLVNDTSR